MDLWHSSNLASGCGILCSVVDGNCLVEGNITEITATTEGRKVWVPTYHQVRRLTVSSGRISQTVRYDYFSSEA